MKDKILIGLIIVLTLALFVETAYILQLHFDKAKTNIFSNKSFFFDIFKERTQDRINELLRNRFNFELDGNLFDNEYFGENYLFNNDTEIKETEKNYIVKLKLPDMEKEKINVELKDNTLIISGDQNIRKVEKDEHGIYRKEQRFGTFRKVIPLPGEVKEDEVKTEYKDGTLIVKLPKVYPGKTIKGTKIEVQI